jgi:GWxTD domain-containing protein
MKALQFVVFALGLMALANPLWAGHGLDIDCAVFHGNDSLNYVEVYAAVQRSGLNYIEVRDTMRAEFLVSLDFMQDSTIAISDTFHAIDDLDTSQNRPSAGQFFAHVFRLMMKRGTYDLKATLFQPGSEPIDEATMMLKVVLPEKDSLRFSGIELGSKLDFTAEKSILLKNGVRVVPNATRFFGTNMPLLYYYAEAYGLDYNSAAIDSYQVVRRILDTEFGNPVRPEVMRMHKTAGSAVVIADGFPVATLKTGSYILDLEINSIRSGRIAHARKPFWIYRREDFAAGRSMKPDSSYSSRVREDEPDFLEVVSADSALDWMRYILSKDEQSQVKRLTLDGKRQFLKQYWMTQEKLRPGAGNQYFARVVECNYRFSVLTQPGWKTDRGRVFILYGEPDHITMNYATADVPDHEEWDYDKLEGGVLFIFFDRNGFGDLDLVHSTKRGEIYNPNWRQLAPFHNPTQDDLR